mgnify:CR=1 FL=1
MGCFLCREHEENVLSNAFQSGSIELGRRDMAKYFALAPFDSDVSDWNVGQVTSVAYMFVPVTAFNQDISDWDVL